MISYGKPPFLECSSKGEKRLSAFYARPPGYGGKSIEQLYQAAKIFADGTTGLSWRGAKGRTPVNIEEVRQLYSKLWDDYIMAYPELLRLIKNASGLSDKFGQQGHACQAEELWRIRNNGG
jgi:hypothetical protein